MIHPLHIAALMQMAVVVIASVDEGYAAAIFLSGDNEEGDDGN